MHRADEKDIEDEFTPTWWKAKLGGAPGIPFNSLPPPILGERFYKQFAGTKGF